MADILPFSQERADSVTSQQDAGSRVPGWTVAAGIGLLVGAGAVGILRRGRREG